MLGKNLDAEKNIAASRRVTRSFMFFYLESGCCSLQQPAMPPSYHVELMEQIQGLTIPPQIDSPEAVALQQSIDEQHMLEDEIQQAESVSHHCQTCATALGECK